MDAANIDLNKLTNSTVRVAIEAFQQGDKEVWKSLFIGGAELYDDGKPRDLAQFSENAVGHERFTNIDEVRNDGRDVYGTFHSDEWGDFRTYFKFQLTDEGKIERLDIGQA